MDSRPVIFVFTTSYHPFVGGAEVAITEVTRRLNQRFDFCIITARFRRNVQRREVRPEGTVFRLGIGNGLDKWLLPVLAVFFVIWKFQKSKRSLAWGMDIGQGSFAASLLKLFLRSIPFVLTVQYGDGGERVRSGRFGLIGFTFRWMLRRASKVTVISRYLSDLVRLYGYRRPIAVVYNGVDFQKFKMQSSKFQIAHQKQKVVITVSRLVRKNGVDVLIRAVSEVKREIPDIQCHIIGDGPDRRALERLAWDLGLQQNVTFAGRVLPEQVPYHLARADVFVRASRSEGMGNAFIEALAAGLPIIGTPVEGIRDIIEDGVTGLFARVDNVGDLAEKMMRLLQDKSLAARIVENGRRMVRERFDWDRIAEQYRDIFESVLETQP